MSQEPENLDQPTTGTGTLTLSVSPEGEMMFKLEEGEKSIAVLMTPDEARKLGVDFISAATRADLEAEK